MKEYLVGVATVMVLLAVILSLREPLYHAWDWLVTHFILFLVLSAILAVFVSYKSYQVARRVQKFALSVRPVSRGLSNRGHLESK